MTLRRTALIPVAALVLAIIPAAASAHSVQLGKSAGLVGEVGPGFSVEVKQNGKDVKTLRAGTYTIKIEDKSSIHNFHLIGKGLNKSTTVAFSGKQRWKITLKAGTYTYQCDPHASVGMKGKFKVTG
jgi:plastocyanin